MRLEEIPRLSRLELGMPYSITDGSVMIGAEIIGDSKRAVLRLDPLEARRLAHSILLAIDDAEAAKRNPPKP